MTRVERIAKLESATHDASRTPGERAMFAAKVAEMTRIARKGAELYQSHAKYGQLDISL